MSTDFPTSEFYGFSMISTLRSRDHRDSPEAEASSVHEHTHAVPQLNSEVPESPMCLGKAKESVASLDEATIPGHLMKHSMPCRLCRKTV